MWNTYTWSMYYVTRISSSPKSVEVYRYGVGCPTSIQHINEKGLITGGKTFTFDHDFGSHSTLFINYNPHNFI